MILLTIYGIYLQAANNQLDSNIKINFEEAQVLKLKSTFYAFNQSLGMTWFVSTVQAVFAAGDEGLGCGYDDGLIGRRFWLQDNGVSDRNFTRGDLAGMTGKYNGQSTPSVCYPKDDDITAYVRNSLVTGGYIDLPAEIKPGGVEINPEILGYQINIDDDGVQSIFSQKITASYGKGTISTTTENVNTVKTKLSQIAAAGRQAVENLLIIGDAHDDPDNQYAFFRPYHEVDPTAAAYVSKEADRIKAGIENSAGAGVKADVMIHNVSIYADDGAKLDLPWSGLILGYDATVRYSESSGASATGIYDIPTDSKEVTSCYGYRAEPAEWHDGIDIAPGTTGVSEPVYAIESGMVANVYNGCQEGAATCGADGFGGYGNIVMIQHDDFYSLYAHLASAGVETGQTVSQGEQIGMMGNTGKSTGMHLHLEIRKGGDQQDPCNYVKCSESTGKACTAYDAPGRYYYYDKENTFTKRPIIMEFEVQDSLPVMSCLWWSGWLINESTIGRDIPIFFDYTKSNDVMCCSGYVFSCGTDIDKLPDDHKLQPGESTDNNIASQGYCNLILRGGNVACTNNGFQLPTS